MATQDITGFRDILNFRSAPKPSSSSDEEVQRKPEDLPRRRATVYDSVAGKVTQKGFLGPKTLEQKAANQPLRPDEVLFKQLNAPTRYEETDYYFAHRDLAPGQHLPSGDVLTGLHAYISKLYARTEEIGKQKVWKCMDETALIALGILMEESAKEILGETGDLAFLEAERSDEEKAFQDESGDETRSVSRQSSERKDSGRRYSHDGNPDADLSDSASAYATEGTD